MIAEPSPQLIFGEVLFDVFPDGQRVLGGAPFNVAWNLHQLGEPVCFVGGIGNDPAGAAVQARMLGTIPGRDAPADLKLVQVDDHHIGFAFTGTADIDLAGIRRGAAQSAAGTGLQLRRNTVGLDVDDIGLAVPVEVNHHIRPDGVGLCSRKGRYGQSDGSDQHPGKERFAGLVAHSMRTSIGTWTIEAFRFVQTDAESTPTRWT